MTFAPFYVIINSKIKREIEKMSVEYHLSRVLLITNQILSKSGGRVISKSLAQMHGEKSTAQEVMRIYHDHFNFMRDEYKEVEELIDWLRNDFIPTNDFGRKIAGIATQDKIREKDIPFIVYASDTKRRAEEKEKSDKVIAEHSKQSEYIGTLKKRDDFFMKLVKIVYSKNYQCYIHLMVDRTSNIGIVWKDDKMAEVSECILFRGTPVKHYYNDTGEYKTTKFNRVNLLKNYGSK